MDPNLWETASLRNWAYPFISSPTQTVGQPSKPKKLTPKKAPQKHLTSEKAPPKKLTPVKKTSNKRSPRNRDGIILGNYEAQETDIVVNQPLPQRPKKLTAKKTPQTPKKTPQIQPTIAPSSSQNAANIPQTKDSQTHVTVNSANNDFLEGYDWIDSRPEEPSPYNELLSYSEDGKNIQAELNDEESDISDEEYHIASDGLKTWSNKLLKIAKRLQREAGEGKLPSQQAKLKEPITIVQATGEEDSPIGSEDEGQIKRRSNRSVLVSYDSDFSKFQWKVGQRFPSREEFRQAVAKYAILQGRNLEYLVSNKGRRQ
ncbi:Serine--tRNA ligase [Bienertia sinuspersici]